MSVRFRFAVPCLLAVALALPACGSDNNGAKPTDAGVPDAAPVLGGKLGAAFASAAAAANSAGPKSQSKGQDGDQPPENGVFAEGEADKRLAKGAQPKITFTSEGTEPKVQFATRLDAPEQKTTVGIAMRMGQGRLPNIDFSLAIKPEKPKDKPKDAAPAASGTAAAVPAAAADGAPVRMLMTVVGTSLPSTQGIPKDMLDAIGKLKGTLIHYDLSAAGGVTNTSVELPKGAGDGLELIVDALLDTIGMFSVPLPTQPIGKDGFWLATDRAKTAAGLEVIRYRVFKVQKIENGAITLAVDIRQYAADSKLKIDSGPQKGELNVDGFDSQGKGVVIWKPDTYLPIRGDMTERVLAKLSPPGTPPNARGGQGVQTELTGMLGGGTGVPSDDKP